MSYTDIATRVYNHHFRMDPVVRTLLDTDFYKLLMAQLILLKHQNTRVKFGLINRSKGIRLADDIDIVELREQLDHARTLRFTKKELIWLAGNSFYGKKQMFQPEYLSWLEGFALPEYDIEVRDGQYELCFDGPWAETSMWEIPALSIINELRARSAMRKMGRFELDVLYARAKAKLWAKIERLQALKAQGPLKVGDFGTRRRHGYLWQQWCCEALREGIGDAFVGTSNVNIAMEIGTEAIGTNAHELAMVYAALAGGDTDAGGRGREFVMQLGEYAMVYGKDRDKYADHIRASRYAVLQDWSQIYDGNLLMILPDAYGTTSFLKDAPDWVANWTGARPDSKPPIEGGDEFIDWWKAKGQNPAEKLLVLSDGMDINSIEETFFHFKDRVRVSYGWGTNLTNDFRGCAPKGGTALDPISLVCKVVEVEGRPAVKLSDNPTKATGPKEEIRRYLEIFGTEGMTDHTVSV